MFDQYYRLLAADTYWSALTTCRDTHNGRLVQWSSWEEQYTVESIIFGNQSDTTFGEYWLGGMGMFSDSAGLFRWTSGFSGYGEYYWKRGDMWDGISEVLWPFPSDGPVYTHWGTGEPAVWGLWADSTPGADCRNEPTDDYDDRCMVATQALAYATVGANYSRVVNDTVGNAWGWARARCTDYKPYICISQSKAALLVPRELLLGSGARRLPGHAADESTLCSEPHVICSAALQPEAVTRLPCARSPRLPT